MYKNILNHIVWKFKEILFQRMLQDYKFNGIFDRKKIKIQIYLLFTLWHVKQIKNLKNRKIILI